MKFEYDELVSELNKNKIKICFTKADGNIREMEVTRNLGLIPIESHPKGDKTPEPIKLDSNGEQIKPSTIKVYSFGDLAWRSFKVESLLKFQILS
jgi:hypothetical protein